MLEPHDHATLTLSRTEPAYGFQDVQQRCASLRSLLQYQWSSTRDLREVGARLRTHDLSTLLQELEARLDPDLVPLSPSRATLLTLTHAYESLLQLQQHLHELRASGQHPDTRWFASWRSCRVSMDTLEIQLRVVKERLARVTTLLEMPALSPVSRSRALPPCTPRQPIDTPSQPIDIPRNTGLISATSASRVEEMTAFSASPNFVYTEILLEEAEGGIVTNYWGEN